MTFQRKYWSFLPAPEKAAFSSGKEDGCRLEESFAHTCSAVKMACSILVFYSPENKTSSPRCVCMTRAEKLCRNSWSVIILKQQWQVTAGATHKNRNAPGTAYDSLLSLAHKRSKPLTGTKDSLTVQITRTALLQMIMLMPPLWLIKGCPSVQLSKVLTSVKQVYTKLLSQTAVCWHSETNLQDHLPKLKVVNKLAKQCPFTENPSSEIAQKIARWAIYLAQLNQR